MGDPDSLNRLGWSSGVNAEVLPKAVLVVMGLFVSVRRLCKR